MRLDKYLSSQGVCIRKDVKKIIKEGRVIIEGMERVSADTKVDPERARVFVDGKLAEYRRFVYLMLNKPKGYVSATEDKDHKTVIDLVPESYRHRNLFPMGRLDIDTEGLCIITDDGVLAHRLLSPQNHVPKTYVADLNGDVTDDDIRAFKEGITLEDGYVCKSAQLEKIQDCRAKVVIYEGKFHQVKRMFAARGKAVKSLVRTKIGGLSLNESLNLGEIRELTQYELDLLQERRDRTE